MAVGAVNAAPASVQPLNADAYALKPSAQGQSQATTPAATETAASDPGAPAAPPPGLGGAVDIQA